MLAMIAAVAFVTCGSVHSDGEISTTGTRCGGFTGWATSTRFRPVRWAENCEAINPEVELAKIFFEYGEERHSRRIARAIARVRAIAPITDTLQLAEIVKQAHPAWEKHKHPATRVFQAIRIFINDELKDLEKALLGITEVLGIGGRMVVISFHSLEDRLVKRFITKQVKGDDFPPDLPVTQSQLNPTMKRVGKPVKAGENELAGNMRARSAVLRVAEKIA